MPRRPPRSMDLWVVVVVQVLMYTRITQKILSIVSKSGNSRDPRLIYTPNNIMRLLKI